MINTGILLDEKTGDLDLSKGRMSLGDCRSQTAEILLLAEQGEIKEYPQLGLGIQHLLGGQEDGAFTIRAKKQLKHCKIPVYRLYFKNNKLNIEYQYANS